MISKSI